MKKAVDTKRGSGIAAWFRDNPVRWYDWVVIGVLFLFCFLSYESRDLFHTAGCSYGYLDGHFHDFYDYLAEFGMGENNDPGLHAAYLPTVYLLFAVWNLPMKLFGVVPQATAMLSLPAILWAKLLPTLVYLGCGFVVYLISDTLGFGKRKAKLAAFASVTMPVAVFSQFIMGQYESFALLTVLLGTYFWLKKKPFWFVFWFAVGCSFKYTVLLFFLPLLLLGEKNLWKILLSLLGAVSLTALEILLYSFSPVFRESVFGIGGGADSPVNNVFEAWLNTGFTLSDATFKVYLVILTVGGTAAYSYFLSPKDEEEKNRYAMFLLPLSFAAMFCFTKWHPQWLLLAVPFWTIGSFMTKHTKIRLVLELLFSAMLNNGIFKYLMPGRIVSEAFGMTEILKFPDPSIALSVLTALMAIFAFAHHPKLMQKDLTDTPKHTLSYVRVRTIAGLLVFIVPSLLSLYFTVRPPKMHYAETNRTAETEIGPSGPVLEFTASGDTISKIKFRKGTARGTEPLPVTVKIFSGNETLYTAEYDASAHYPSEQVIIKPNVRVTPGDTYRLSFSRPENAEGEVRLFTDGNDLAVMIFE